MTDVDHPTERRLLEAAVELFADQGFAATSVRQVCTAAGANVASVNYYFGSKRALYDAAIDFARAESNARNPWVALDERRDFWSDAAPDVRLRRFIAMLLDHGLDGTGGTSSLARMMFHEMLDPTPAWDRQVEVSIARVFDALRDICRELAGPDVDDATLTRLAVIINGQCMYPALASGCLSTMEPEVRLDGDGRAALAELVADGVLATIRGLREGSATDQRGTNPSTPPASKSNIGHTAQ